MSPIEIRHVRLEPRRWFWLRFPVGIYSPTIAFCAVMWGISYKNNWEGSLFELLFLFLAPVTCASLFGLLYIGWFVLRRGVAFQTYAAYADKAIKLAVLALLVVDVAVPLSLYILETGEVGPAPLLIWFLLTPALAFVGFPILFTTVFFFVYVAYRKIDLPEIMQ